MAKNETIISFEGVSFEYNAAKPILESVDFSVRRGTKTTLMGQNGAGKSTIFSIITGATRHEGGKVSAVPRLSIALSLQVIPRDELDLTVRDFFQKRFSEKVYYIDPRIDDVL